MIILDTEDGREKEREGAGQEGEMMGRKRERENTQLREAAERNVTTPNRHL